MSEEQKVAPKLLASQRDLELISDGSVNKLLTFKGWRHEIFGKLALDLAEKVPALDGGCSQESGHERASNPGGRNVLTREPKPFDGGSWGEVTGHEPIG